MRYVHERCSRPPQMLRSHQSIVGSLRPLKDLLRWILLMCVLLLTSLTMTNLHYVQRTLDRFDLETLPAFFSTNRHMQNYKAHGHHDQIIPVLSGDNALHCLVHDIVLVNASSKRLGDPNQTILIPLKATNCGNLRRRWLQNPPLSPMAQQIENHQTNCSVPVATHYFDNTFGLGSHLILWGQALCNAMPTTSTMSDESFRIQSKSPDTWLWLDQTHCDLAEARYQSPLLCYFPKAEQRCREKADPMTITRPLSSSSSLISYSRNISDPRDKKFHCPWVQNPETRSLFRAAATEYLFQQLSPLVIQEARRQIGIVFASNHGIVPENLITVHIRWGDKFWEMDLPPIEEYIEAVHNLTIRDTMITAPSDVTPSRPISVYLATEDPKAHEAFLSAKPKEWIVYSDITLLEINPFRPKKGNRASWATRNTKGRAGLVALGSLLVAMEANRFVLTTKSNWSKLINHLRTNIIDPRCGNCTTMIDLRPGEYF